MDSITIALTFDDGPSDDCMPRVLELLKQYGANATFFIRGDKITAENVSLLKKCAEEGNELANHSIHHLHMSQLDADGVREETAPLQNLLADISGEPPVLFRPPYLNVSTLMQQQIPLPFIHGSSSLDWNPKTSTAERIRLVQEAAADGAIILMHCFEGNYATVEALEVLLPWFAERNIKVTTVRNLFAEKGITPIPGKVYNAVTD